jgi:hypothetical protein
LLLFFFLVFDTLLLKVFDGAQLTDDAVQGLFESTGTSTGQHRDRADPENQRPDVLLLA